MNQILRWLNVVTITMAVAVPAVAHTQALPAAYGPGSNLTVGGGFSWYQQDYGHRKIGGGFSYVDAHANWRYAVEGEARFLKLGTSQEVSESTWLAGVKVNVTGRPKRLQPYAKLLAGAGRITLPYHYAYGTFFTYAPGAGVDYTANDRWTVRIVDVEVQRWPDFPYGALQPYGISTGISFRLNGTPRIPSGRGAR